MAPTPEADISVYMLMIFSIWRHFIPRHIAHTRCRGKATNPIAAASPLAQPVPRSGWKPQVTHAVIPVHARRVRWAAHRSAFHAGAYFVTKGPVFTASKSLIFTVRSVLRSLSLHFEWGAPLMKPLLPLSASNIP